MHRHDVALLRGAAIPSLAVAAGVVILAALVGGADSALGAFLGCAVVTAFFGVGLVVISSASRFGPFVMMQVALATYLVKIVLLGVLVATLSDTTAFDTRAFAAAVLVLTLVWLTAEVRTFSRLRILYVDPHGEQR